MGFTPADVDGMSIWEFTACRAAWDAAHGGEEAAQAEPMSVERMRALGIKGV